MVRRSVQRASLLILAAAIECTNERHDKNRRPVARGITMLARYRCGTGE